MFFFAVETVTFSGFETSKTVTIDIVDDSTIEGNENFQVELSNPQGLQATLGTPKTATVTILENDTASPTSSPTSVLGDVHFGTLDGVYYTFNAAGDYIYMKWE